MFINRPIILALALTGPCRATAAQGPAPGRWTQGPAMPSSRTEVAVAEVDGKISDHVAPLATRCETMTKPPRTGVVAGGAPRQAAQLVAQAGAREHSCYRAYFMSLADMLLSPAHCFGRVAS